MSKQRKHKPNDPDYIDIFAEEDDDAGAPVSVGSLFDDEDGESVPAARKKPEQPSRGLFSRKKKPAPEEPEEDGDEDGEEEYEEESRPKKRGLFSRKKKSAPKEPEEDVDEDGEEEYEDEPRSEKRGLFSRKKADAQDYDEDEDDLYGEEDEDGASDDEDDSRGLLSSLVSWRERDEDEAPPRNAVAEEDEADGDMDDVEDEEEPETADTDKKKRFSLSSLLKKKKNGGDGESGANADETDGAEEDRKAPAPRREYRSPVYTVPGVNKDEDWDIGGDFSDPFAEPEPDTAEPESVTETDAEEEYEPSAEEKARTFSFDRYGRRREKTGRKTRYGHRKNAKKATTTVVTNETDTRREEAQARLRAEKRDIIRDREIKKRKEERRVRIIRELKQRLTVAGLLGILLVIVLLAAYFAFRITGIDVTGVCKRYSPERIVEISGLRRGRHILLQDLSEARDRLNADPYLSASVKYVFPNKININVSERRGIGAVQWGPDSEFLALIDTSGYVLEADMASAGGLPVVKGLVVTRVVAGTKIGDEADEQVQSTLDVLSALDEFGLLYSVNSVDMSETMGISMYTPEGYRIELGSVADLNTKLNRLKKGWKTIMNTAAEQMKKPSVDNVTIYLYTKNGVSVSPHGVGYVDESQTPAATVVSLAPEPEPVPEVQPGIVYSAPEPTPEPQDIIPSFNDVPFTG